MAFIAYSGKENPSEYDHCQGLSEAMFIVFFLLNELPCSMGCLNLGEIVNTSFWGYHDSRTWLGFYASDLSSWFV